MRRILKMTSLMILVFCSGCYVQSLNKFYTDETKVEIRGILGEWQLRTRTGDHGTENNINPWKFTKDHVLSYDQDNSLARLDVAYFKVDKNYFIDFTAGDPEAKRISIYWTVGIVLVHSLCKVEVSQDNLVVKPLDFAWLKQKLEDQEVALPHVVLEDKDRNTIFTASPNEWQNFLKEYGSNKNAFPENKKLAFVRKK